MRTPKRSLFYRSNHRAGRGVDESGTKGWTSDSLEWRRSEQFFLQIVTFNTERRCARRIDSKGVHVSGRLSAQMDGSGKKRRGRSPAQPAARAAAVEVALSID